MAKRNYEEKKVSFQMHNFVISFLVRYWYSLIEYIREENKRIRPNKLKCK